jgi:hypothetical protein
MVRSVAWAVALVLALGFLLGMCSATRAHDWYPKSCCNGHDCKPVRAYYGEDEFWHIYVEEYNDWFIVPTSQIRKEPTPDLSCHACYGKGMGMGPRINVFCFFPCGVKS